MNMEVANYDGVFYIALDNPELMDEFINVVENTIKSQVFCCDFEGAGRTIKFLLELYDARKKAKEAGKSAEDSR